MHHHIPTVALVALLVAGCQNAPSPMNGPASPTPPKAEKKPHVISAHGHARNDEYYWLRLSEEQRKAGKPDAHTREVLAHLEAENTYCEGMLAPVKELREELFSEMRARVKEADLSVPYRENGYWYHSRFEETKT